MKNFSLFTIALIPLVVGFGACAAEDPVPGDKIAAPGEMSKVDQSPSELSSQSLNLEDQSSNFESTVQDAEHEPRACRVNLLYCEDPREGRPFTGRPTYCSNDCESEHAREVASDLCNNTARCNHCSDLYRVGGC